MLSLTHKYTIVFVHVSTREFPSSDRGDNNPKPLENQALNPQAATARLTYSGCSCRVK